MERSRAGLSARGSRARVGGRYCRSVRDGPIRGPTARLAAGATRAGR